MLTFPITAVSNVFKITTAYIKNVILFEPSAPATQREEIIIIFAKLPKIRVGKLKSERFNSISTPLFLFFIGFTKA